MYFRMTKTIAETEKKTGTIDGTEEYRKGRGWIFWVCAPLALLTIAGSAFLVVRRRFAESRHI
jgi:hypothetical protein